MKDQVIVCCPQSYNLARKIQRDEGGEIIVRLDYPRMSVYTMPRSLWLRGEVA